MSNLLILNVRLVLVVVTAEGRESLVLPRDTQYKPEPCPPEPRPVHCPDCFATQLNLEC